MHKLEIELVPKTCFYVNLRSELARVDWDRLRKLTYKANNYRCEVCGGKGHKHPVECHEIWAYDDEHKLQVLIGLEALCPMCHKVKHIGKAQVDGVMDVAIEHFCRVNDVGYAEAIDYIEDVFRIWRGRSLYDWRQDLSFIERFNITPPNKIENNERVSSLLGAARGALNKSAIADNDEEFRKEMEAEAQNFDEWD